MFVYIAKLALALRQQSLLPNQKADPTTHTQCIRSHNQNPRIKSINFYYNAMLALGAGVVAADSPAPIFPCNPRALTQLACIGQSINGSADGARLPM